MTVLSEIILIDDDKVFNFLNATVIKKSKIGIEPKVFTSARAALDYLQLVFNTHTIPLQRLIFLDINMPELTGWDFLQHFEEMPDEFTTLFHIYMLSSSTDAEDAARSRTYKQVVGFISKPLTVTIVQSILDKIHGILDSSRE